MANRRAVAKARASKRRADRQLGREIESRGLVRVHDDEHMEAGRCNNGGHYGFWTVYRFNGRWWEVSHHTTAEFDYCPRCGKFGGHWEWDWEEINREGGDVNAGYWICPPAPHVSTMELVGILRSVEADTTECLYEGGKARWWTCRD